MNTIRWQNAVTALMVVVLAAAPGVSRAEEDATGAPAHVRAATPGSQHELLAGLVGEYALTSTFWPDPDGAPEVSHLPAHREMLLGGRVLKLEVGPDEGGFRGTGLAGFDNATGQFWYVWTDTSTTGIAQLVGSRAADGTGSFEGLMPTPFGPTPLWVDVRTEGDTEIHDYRVRGADGERVRFLELRYVRQR